MTNNTNPRSEYRLHYEPCNSFKELDEIIKVNPLWPEWYVQWVPEWKVAIFKLPILAVAKKRARVVPRKVPGGEQG